MLQGWFGATDLPNRTDAERKASLEAKIGEIKNGRRKALKGGKPTARYEAEVKALRVQIRDLERGR